MNPTYPRLTKEQLGKLRSMDFSKNPALTNAEDDLSQNMEFPDLPNDSILKIRLRLGITVKSYETAANSLV